MPAGPQQDGVLRRLTKRSEFLRAARGKRVGRPAFSLQANERALPQAGIGFTVTKQVGNSPERNRIKRRLRALARTCATRFQPQHDYVLLGRRDALHTPFDQLTEELAAALSKIHTLRGDRPRNER